ncbi:hypothetical protein [Leptospira kanakyensis]|uniref:Uncharacterized protein n=1 Tax=Leptospira kanakyensis TaxID=2484968 RepID=A0A6N4QFA7_9LEPT|nr:hypothetical protein [Leptospira kanakyensis]TGK46264.1 hypothetical protein EHQ11_18945 [Leptospira kanakyensis]TGK71499.1 hypothetical protein EHQ18_08230 [Leptospira kanakyensis]
MPDPSRHSQSWYSSDIQINLLNFFHLFEECWQSQKDFLKRMIKWYLDCSKFDTSQENILILGQALLESFFYEIYVLKKKIFQNSDSFEKLIASDKIRLTLDYLNIPFEISIESTYLKAAAKNENWIDIPHALTSIRNNIVHPKKNQKMNSLGERVIGEATRIIIYYSELLILYLLNYKGKIISRTKISTKPEPVPWEIEKS